jgi:hypothetical protein
VASQRRFWANTSGKWISLICLGVGALFGILAALSAAELFDWSFEGGDPISHWWGTGAFGLICVVLVGFAFRPTWSITVGKRGIGIRKLWRHVFIRYDEFQSAQVDEVGEPPRVRIVTSKGSLGIFPRINDPEGLAKHLTMMKRDSQT